MESTAAALGGRTLQTVRNTAHCSTRSIARRARSQAGSRSAGSLLAATRQTSNSSIDQESMTSTENFLMTTSLIALAAAGPALAEEEIAATGGEVAEAAKEVVESVPEAAVDAVAPAADTVAPAAAEAGADAAEAVNPLLKYFILFLPLILYSSWTVFRTVNKDAKLLDFVTGVVGVVVVGNLVSILAFKQRIF